MCAGIIALNLFNLVSNGNAFNFRLIVSSYELFCSIGSTYIYCYLSNVVMASLLDCGDAFYQYAWYDLTVKQQKIIFLVIRRAHNEFCFNGLGLVYCSLDTFLSVILKIRTANRWNCDKMRFFYVTFSTFSSSSDNSNICIVLCYHSG